MFIAGVALISGMGLLRKYMKMKKTLQKPKTSEYPRHLYATVASNFGIPASPEASGFRLQTSENSVRNEINQSDFQTVQNVPEEEPITSLRSQYEQFDVELLMLSRQIKAEIDTKIIALQLMIADADQVLQRLEGHLIQPHQVAMTTPHLAEPERMRILKHEETAPVFDNSQSFPIQNVPTPEVNTTPHSTLHIPHSSHDPGDMKNLVVEDPFAVNDFGFDKAMRDLDQLSSSIPAFEAMRSLDVWDTLKSENPASLPKATLPEWDTPLSYPISGYRPAQDRLTPQVHDTPTYHAVHGVASRTSPRKKTYTNKLLTQAPPQLDALMTDEPVGKMGRKQRRTAGQTSGFEDDPLVPPMIPKSLPPNAKALLVETAPFSQADIGSDKISVRRGKRHQLQYLIEKGMSAKEIASHLEMPVGEVELIFSLHKRLSGETTKAIQQPLTDEAPTVSPRVIAAEHVAALEKTTGKATSSKRRFKVIKSDDGEQVA